jgi:hypothetical protein
MESLKFTLTPQDVFLHLSSLSPYKLNDTPSPRQASFLNSPYLI